MPKLNQELKKLETFYHRFDALQNNSNDDDSSDDKFDSSSSNDTSSSDDQTVYPCVYHHHTYLRSGEPDTYKQDVRGPELLQWYPAIHGEIENFLTRDAWKKFLLWNLLKGRKPIPTKWVFKKKNEPNGTI